MRHRHVLVLSLILFSLAAALWIREIAYAAANGDLTAMITYIPPDHTAAAAFPSTWKAIGSDGSIVGRGPEGIAALGLASNFTDSTEWTSTEFATSQCRYYTPEEFISERLAVLLTDSAGIIANKVTIVCAEEVKGYTFPAIVADLDLELAGGNWRGIFFVTTWRVYGCTRWGAYVSGVATSQERFGDSLAVLLAVFNSFHPEPRYGVGDEQPVTEAFWAVCNQRRQP
ncbi:MAG TPA: hypothetical protein DCY84_05015 [Firmicutes bacterium]|jgi:hypothetical protein|nr:hypothetical protein [Bacillota bacterium]HAZ21708.1 hypothetical protein [Bacillota bacterium]HBG45164.1 hypothetical protein [Bacillota bacterium]HBL49488.1 hypothetical protein [Bacillota bacterium]HBL67860.1 hypothetical protein [Bacillota bacterium]